MKATHNGPKKTGYALCSVIMIEAVVFTVYHKMFLSVLFLLLFTNDMHQWSRIQILVNKKFQIHVRLAEIVILEFKTSQKISDYQRLLREENGLPISVRLHWSTTCLLQRHDMIIVLWFQLYYYNTGVNVCLSLRSIFRKQWQWSVWSISSLIDGIYGQALLGRKVDQFILLSLQRSMNIQTKIAFI